MMFGFIADLGTNGSIFFIACILMVLLYEAINGFHDTANAVATVIYTKTLKPWFAVIWSGVWNFLGVFAGGIAVAMGMIKMLPLNDLMSQPLGENIALVMAVLITAIAWNLGTWWFGIPCSSSHTLIGALLGGGFAFWKIHGGAGIDTHKAKDVGMALLFSPFFGFTMAIILMMFLRGVIKNKAFFNEPDPKKAPPIWVRAWLIVTCTLVSFFHGSNDGQKGVGLMLVVLIGFMPMHFALNEHIPMDDLKNSVSRIETALHQIGPDSLLNNKQKALLIDIGNIKSAFAIEETSGDKKNILALRKNIQTLVNDTNEALKDGDLRDDAAKSVRAEIGPLKKSYEFAPIWVMALISLALGIGTMIGWKRIVVTIGEKIGKSHLTYAQGATAELIAAMTIGLSTWFGAPVSTTHVLSSGVAGTMVATGGTKNLRKKTLTNILLAWVLTLPVTFISGAILYLVFRMFV